MRKTGKKIFKAVASAVLALALTVPAVACGGADGGDDADKTVIQFMNFGGGIGDVWLEKAADRFEALHANDSYEEGKTGVEIKISSSTNTNTKAMATSGYAIYTDESTIDVDTFASEGKLLDITDIVTELDENGDSIESKIDEGYRGAVKYAGKYYALPHYSVFSGTAYDIDCFINNELYIAKPGAGEEFTAFGYTYNFTGNLDDASCGNDGVYGTSDDGLPSSFTELLVLCAKMSDNNIVPFSIAGTHLDYSNYFCTALFASLAGEEAMQANYSFNGEVEIVTGWSDENLLKNNDGLDLKLKKPITQKVAVTEKTGYHTTNQKAKYYAAAFIEIAQKSGWFTKNSENSNSNHNNAQDDFIFSGLRTGAQTKPKVGMLMEGSHWWNEIRNSGSFTNYCNLTKKTDRNVGWLTFPTLYEGSVKEGEGHKNVTVSMTKGCVTVINANIKSEGLIKASKDFVKFLYSDAELIAFTQETGVTRSAFDLEYKVDEPGYENLSRYEKTYLKSLDEKNLVKIMQYADNPTFRANTDRLISYLSSSMWATAYTGVIYHDYLEIYRMKSLAAENAQTIFEHGVKTQSAWENSYYKGNE